MLYIKVQNCCVNSKQKARGNRLGSFVLPFFPPVPAPAPPICNRRSRPKGCTDGENCFCNSPQFDATAANLLLQGVAVRIFLFLQTFSIPKHPTHSPLSLHDIPRASLRGVARKKHCFFEMRCGFLFYLLFNFSHLRINFYVFGLVKRALPC